MKPLSITLLKLLKPPSLCCVAFSQLPRNPPHLPLTQHLAGSPASHAFSFPCLFCPNCCCPHAHPMPFHLTCLHPTPSYAFLCPGGRTLLEPAFDLDLVFLEICRNSPLLSEYSPLFPGLDWPLFAFLSSHVTRPPCSSPSFHFTLPLSVCLPCTLFPAPSPHPFSYCQNPKEAEHIFHAMLPLPVTILPHVACAQPNRS